MKEENILKLAIRAAKGFTASRRKNLKDMWAGSARWKANGGKNTSPAEETE
jgi:hypothetical protein